MLFCFVLETDFYLRSPSFLLPPNGFSINFLFPPFLPRYQRKPPLSPSPLRNHAILLWGSSSSLIPAFPPGASPTIYLSFPAVSLSLFSPPCY